MNSTISGFPGQVGPATPDQNVDLPDQFPEKPSQKETNDDAEPPITPAESLLGTCRRLGIALRVEPGCLVVGTPGGPDIPVSLMWALEAHVKAVARLVIGPQQVSPTQKRPTTG